MKKEDLEELRRKLAVIGAGLVSASGILKGVAKLHEDLIEDLDKVIKKIDKESKD